MQSVRVATALIVAILLASMFVAGNASAQKDWRTPGSQRCAVDPASCSGGGNTGGGNKGGSNDSGTSDPQYDQMHEQMIAAWKRASGGAPDDWREILQLLYQMQKMRDGSLTRGRIAQVKAQLAAAEAYQAEVAAAVYQRRVKGSELNNLGDAAWRRGERVQAREYFESALLLWPENEGIKSNVAIAREYFAGIGSSGLPKSVENAIANVFKNSPDGVSGAVTRGFQAVMRRDWKLAEAWFGTALLRDPGNANIKSFIALVNHVWGDSLVVGADGTLRPKPQLEQTIEELLNEAVKNMILNK